MAKEFGTFKGVGSDFERRGHDAQPVENKKECHVCGRTVNSPMLATKCPLTHCRKCVVTKECPNLEDN